MTAAPELPVNDLNSILKEHPVLNRFVVEKELGHGGHGRAYLAFEQTDFGEKRTTVIKVINGLSSQNAPLVESEWRTQRTFDSPYIVNLLAVEIHPNFQYPVLQLEYCNGGELFQFIEDTYASPEPSPPLNEAEIAQLFQEMLLGVKVLHDNGVIHRDIKPENFLLSATGRTLPNGNPEFNVKVADFGLADFIDGSSEKRGTSTFQAPEFFITPVSYTNKVDIWALGISLYILFTGAPPPVVPGQAEWDPVKGIGFLEDEWESTSPEAQELVKSLLALNPDERYSVDQALAHPWLRGTAPTVPRYDIYDHLRSWNARKKVRRVHRLSGMAHMLLQLDDGESDEEDGGED
jgi:serine/threonine protein kinase